MNQIELSPGEIRVRFKAIKKGKVSFEDLGMSDGDLIFESGLIRLVFDFEFIPDRQYFQVPTIQMAYKEEMTETHWQCEFNGETLVDKLDHHGRSTVILLSRTRLIELAHHHKNELILHAEFPGPVQVKASDSYINFFI